MLFRSIKTKLKWNPGTRTLVSLENDMVLFRKHFGGDSRFRYPDGMTNILSFTRNLSHTTSNGFGGLSRLSVAHKFKKEGRNVNLVGNLNAYQENNKSRIHNYLIGGEQYQTQNFNGNKRKWSIEGYFTEPINRFWNVRLGQQFFQENELQNRSSSTNEVIDSTDFQEGSGTIRTVTENKSSIDLNSTHKKVRYFMGVSVSDIQLKSLEVSRSFQFVLPKFSIKYYLKSAQYVKLNYHTNSVIPRLEQLIDAPDNTNLQRSYIGNPNLRPEYGHNLSLNYFYLNPIKAHNVFVGVQASQMNHKIMNQTTVNSDLTTRISAINLGTYQNIGVIGGISGPIKKLKVAYNISPNFSWSRSHILLNGQKVAVNTSSYFTDISIKRLKKDKWDYKIGASWNNNETRYPSERSMDRKIQSYSWYVNLEYEFFQGFIFKLDYKFRKFVTIISESETEFHYLNVRLKKTIKHNWTLSVIANDILNQNTGIRTSSNLNQINTVQYNSINRYIILAVEYKLRKNKTSKH